MRSASGDGIPSPSLSASAKVASFIFANIGCVSSSMLTPVLAARRAATLDCPDCFRSFSSRASCIFNSGSEMLPAAGVWPFTCWLKPGGHESPVKQGMQEHLSHPRRTCRRSASRSESRSWCTIRTAQKHSWTRESQTGPPMRAAASSAVGLFRAEHQPCHRCRPGAHA